MTRPSTGPGHTDLVYAIPNTMAHLLPVVGDRVTALCGMVPLLPWRDDAHVHSLSVCRVCQMEVSR